MPIGPSRPLNLAKPESIDIRQAARYFGARGEGDSATLTLLEKCAAPLLAAATPGPSGSRPTWRASRRPVF